jgi:hypothetical protein
VIVLMRDDEPDRPYLEGGRTIEEAVAYLVQRVRRYGPLPYTPTLVETSPAYARWAARTWRQDGLALQEKPEEDA